MKTDVYVIRTASESFFVFARGVHAGRIMRCTSQTVVAPSDNWRVREITEWRGAARMQVLNFEYWGGSLPPLETHMVTTKGDAWTFGSGKPRFMLGDYDHGSYRTWGQPIRKISGWSYDLFRQHVYGLAALAPAPGRAHAGETLAAYRSLVSALGETLATDPLAGGMGE